MPIHETAIVASGARLGDVHVGPYAVIDDGVVLDDGVRVGPHSVLHGPLEIGTGTVIHAHAVLGDTPQVRGWDGEARGVVIGAGNVFREFTTVHSGTQSPTTIGDRNYLMASSHVAHDCIVGNDVMFANSAAIAGHVQVGDGAVMGGLAAVHQFARIGRLAMVGGGAMCAQDVPPYCVAQGDRARLYGLNIIGLRRAGLGEETMSVLKEAWRVLFASGLARRSAIARLREMHGFSPEVDELLRFVSTTERGLCRSAVG
jgi:UDP-N-acetylglucosamine acyltransferase